MTQTTDTDKINYSWVQQQWSQGKLITNNRSDVNLGNNIIVRNTDVNYRTRIAKGQDASLPYSRQDHKVKIVDRTMSAWYTSVLPGQPYQYNMAFNRDAVGLTLPSSIPARTSTDDIALSRLKRKLASDVGQFKSLVPLAEINETRGLIRTTAEATQDLLISLIEIRKRPKRVLQNASKAWLQFSFAISPTIQDTHDLLDSIGSYLLRQDHTCRYFGRHSESWSDRVVTNADASTGINGTWHSDYLLRNHDYSVQYTAGVRFPIRSSNSYGVTQHFGLDFGQLPSVGWELIPFSWVVDYFTTMGAFLDDVFTKDAGNTIYCTKSIKYSCKQFLPVRYKAVFPKWDYPWINPSGIFNPAPNSSESFFFNRSVLTAIPHRSLRVKTVDEIGVNAVKRLLNLASILGSGGNRRG